MQLIGSMLEDDLRRALLASNAALRSGDGNPRLCEVLLDLGVDPTSAFVLDWIHEQCEDILTVLDGCHRILEIELPRYDQDEPAKVAITPFAVYREAVNRGSLRKRLQLTIAMALLRERCTAPIAPRSPDEAGSHIPGFPSSR